MKLATIAERYATALETTYGEQLLPSHRRALTAISRCRREGAGELMVYCAHCDQHHWRPQSCGHRNCPACQNHAVTQWLERQHQKLLPVDYFMATFTLPAPLRAVAWHHQRTVYDALFRAVAATLKTFGHNHLGADMGFTAILHTHTRDCRYHPHLHVLIPGGGIDRAARRWVRPRGRYLFNGRALGTVFRAKLLHQLSRNNLPVPADLPKRWVVHCDTVGNGLPALEYLSRYLYRGVIAENNILSDHNAYITFRYIDSATGLPRTHTLRGEDFLWRLLQHVLPRGFHRVRDYGFLHHNASQRLVRVQLLLRGTPPEQATTPRPAFRCPTCGGAMVVLAVRSYRPQRCETSAKAQGPPIRAAM